MIPLRYAGVWHALKLIFHEEGLKGLYRGFFAYLVVVILTFLNFYLYLAWLHYFYIASNEPKVK